MPLVFVHGVATRQTPKYKAEVVQRDALFKSLVMVNGDTFIRDPDWGSGGVIFEKGGWVPPSQGGEAWSVGFSVVAPQGASTAASVAPHDLEQALDLAFGTLLARQAEAEQTNPANALTADQLNAFKAAVKYLEGPADPSAFSPNDNDAQFAQTLESELAPVLGPATSQAMGMKDVFNAIGSALKDATDPLRNAGSDVVLKLFREPLSRLVALFLGDIFVYLRFRETDGAGGTFNRIFKPIVEDLAAASAAAKQQNQPLILVCHSLGAVIGYDLLSDDKAIAAIEAKSGTPFHVDAWITVGAQPGLFADMGLYNRPKDTDNKFARPKRVERWMNVYDYTDVLAFLVEPFFSDVKDYKFDNVSGILEAHTAYFQRPSFYKRLRARLAQP